MRKSTTLIIVIVLAIIIAAGAFSAVFFWAEDDLVFEKVYLPEQLVYLDFDQWKKIQQEQIALFQKKEKEEITLFAVGDIMMSRAVERKMLAKNDFMYCLEPTRKLVQSADIAMANLESPIIEGPLVDDGSFSFRADPRSAEALALAGFDILSLPNNHIMNYGSEGLVKTFEYLGKNNLDYVGVGENLNKIVNPLIKEVKGIKIAFLSYAYGPESYKATTARAGMALMDTEQLIADINTAHEEKVDLIIVSMHDGVEYVNDPAVHQTEFAHVAIDSGADVVLGHHPHVVQKMEIYKDRYIYYSLGNFVFDQMWSQDTREGLGVMLHLNKEGVTDVEYYPIEIQDYCRPELVEGEQAEKIIGKLGS